MKNLDGSIKEIINAIKENLSLLDYDSIIFLEALIRFEKKSRPDEKYY